MFGEPVAMVAPTLGVPGQVERVTERLRAEPAFDDGHRKTGGRVGIALVRPQRCMESGPVQVSRPVRSKNKSGLIRYRPDLGLGVQGLRIWVQLGLGFGAEFSYWLLVTGYWLPVTGYQLPVFATVYQQLATGDWLQVATDITYPRHSRTAASNAPPVRQRTVAVNDRNVGPLRYHSTSGAVFSTGGAGRPAILIAST